MVAVIFCTEATHHVNYTVVYQTNTRHRAASLYNETNAQNKLTFKCWSCHALTLCTNFQVFAHFALQSSPMKLYFWYLFCKHFPEITHQCILFAPLFLHFNPFCPHGPLSGHFLHLKHFEASASLCCKWYTARHWTQFVTFPSTPIANQ